MQALDYGVVVVFLLALVGMGIYFGKQNSRDDFFAAGHSMGILPVGLSVLATLFSSNSFVMYSGAAFGNSLRIGLSLISITLMVPFVVWIFIPVYSRCGCQTAYEYLEQRFHVSVRCLASGLFILLRIGWMASATFSAALVLSVVSGFDHTAVIIVLGIISIFYTMLGGLRAVMWTDVIQFFVFASTIGLTLWLIDSMQPDGLGSAITSYFHGREGMLVDFTPSMTLEYGSWAILIGVFLESVSAFGADQVAVQRYISARSERTSQRAFLLTLAGFWFVVSTLLLIGVGLYAHYQEHPGELREVLARTPDSTTMLDEEILLVARTPEYRDQAMPMFVRTHFPAGMVGLLLAALMAAVMSSIDSGIHSVTTALVVDFRDRLLPQWRPDQEEKDVLFVRMLVGIVGGISVLLACFVGDLGDVFSIGKKLTSAFGGPLLAVFTLALFSSRMRTFGAFTGTLLGASATLLLMAIYTDWFSVWFWPIGYFIALVLALLLDFVIPRKDLPTSPPLTFAEVMRRSADKSQHPSTT